MSSQSDRKIEEATFHDDDRAGHRDECDPGASPNRRFYEVVGEVRNNLSEWIQRVVPDKLFLDYACGNGLISTLASKAGAKQVVGIDISEASIRNAIATATRLGLDTAVFLQRDCEDTGLPSECFDAILCSGMLHHLDLSRAYPELHRILAVGGRIYCQEALAYNPFIQWYRNRTPELRTRWEKDHILGLKEVEYAKKWFAVENLRFYLFATPLAVFLPKGRVRNSGIMIGRIIDTVATRIPLLKYWSWQFSFELVKIS